MRFNCLLALLYLSLNFFAPDSQDEPAQAYRFGSEGIAQPELLPFSNTITPPGHCGEHMDGKVRLSVEIDDSGRPQKIMFIEPHSDSLDDVAIRIASSDRFKPGTLKGAPVPIRASLEVRVRSCVTDFIDATGNKKRALSLRELPEQILGKPGEAKTPGNFSRSFINKGVSAPVPLNSIEAKYSDEGRRKRINGVCIISLIVDEHGMPQNPRVVRSLEPSLDQEALIAVARYRFLPAMKNGTPVPVMISVEVNFRLA